MNKYVKFGLIGLLLVSLGFGAGKYSNPSKVETVTKIEEVIKYVEVKQENKNVVLKTKKTTNVDGSIVEESTTEDKSITKTDTQIDSKKESKSETITIRDLGLSVQALAMAPIKDFDNREYGVLVKKRIIGNVSGTILATHKGTIGLAVGLDF